MTVQTPKGSVTIDGEYATMTFVRRLPYPIETVWAALTDPEQRAAWLGRTTIDGCQGGMIETDPDGPPAPSDKKRLTGRILVWDPPRVLEHEWRQAIVGESVVRYELAVDGETMILTFTHRGLRVPSAMGFIPGTHAYLDRLEAHLTGSEVPDWGKRYAEVEPAYA